LTAPASGNDRDMPADPGLKDLPPFEGYDREQEHPLASYGALVAVFNVAFLGGLAALHRSGRELPERVGLGDVLLIATATQKLSRLITRDRVTSALRAPFTRYQEAAGHGEVEEAARGHGLQRAVGELVVCPYCVSLWVAGGFTLGLVAAPRATRLVGATFSALAVADALQLAYSAAEDASSS
jgi:hypothetical protein